jgi:hypothetical protein
VITEITTDQDCIEKINFFPPGQAHKVGRITTLLGEVREGKMRKGAP